MQNTRENKSTDTRNYAALKLVRIDRNSAGRLVAHFDGDEQPTVDVKIVRYFPWSIPDAYISVRTSQGKEIAMLSSLDDLDPASREIVEDELRDKVFNPKLRRVLSSRHEFGITSVRAETDRGEVIFQFRGRQDIRQLSPTRAIIRDVDSNFYEVENIDALDAGSQRYLRHYF